LVPSRCRKSGSGLRIGIIVHAWKGDGGKTINRSPVLDHKQSFFSQSNSQIWKATIRFSRSCKNAQIRLDDSWHSGGIGGHWHPKRQLLLKAETDFAKGQDFDFDLMELTLDRNNHGPFWHWKVSNSELRLVSPSPLHHCRLVIIENGQVMDDFPFIVIWSDLPKTPLDPAFGIPQ
jgi:hypothetical protein